MKLNELREMRNKAIHDMREIVERNEKNGTAIMSAEDQANYDKAYKDQDDLAAEIKRREKAASIEREVLEAAAQAQNMAPAGGAMPESERQLLAFRAALMNGVQGVPAHLMNALQFDTDSAGGYLSAPEQYVTQLIQAIDDETFIRPKATVFQLTNGHGLGAPSLDADPDDADWTAEITAVSGDSTMAFGKRELTPTLISKLVKVSMKLLRNSTLPAEQIVLQRLAYKFGITEEKAFLTGSGSSQPLGLFTASASGINTDRDISTGNTTISMTFDGLTAAKYKVKAKYQQTGEWLFHRDGVKQIAQLKDGDGQYIWQPSKRDSDPDTLLGRPVNQSEYAPSTFTTGLYVGLFGDFSYYWIAESLGMSIQRLNELYAATNQVGFIGRMEVDGAPVLSEAFARVKLA